MFIMTTPLISVEYTSLFRNKFYEEFNKIGSEIFGFQKIAEFTLPDNGKAIIFKNLNKNF